MIPQKYAHILFGFILSGGMSLLVSGVSTFRALGPSEALAGYWFGAWLSSWAIAFPAVLIAAPLTRRIVARLVRA